MLLDDIAMYLRAQGQSGEIAKGHRPDQPDNLIALFPTGGFAHDWSLPDVHATLQVLVRDKSYVSAYSRIWALYNLLDKPGGDRLVIAGGRRMVVRAMQPPAFLEFDANNRSVFVFNVAIWTSRD